LVFHLTYTMMHGSTKLKFVLYDLNKVMFHITEALNAAPSYALRYRGLR